MTTALNTNEITENIHQWLKTCVIGLGLCPFASYPYTQNTVRIKVSDADNDTDALSLLEQELTLIEQSPETIETSLLVLPHHFTEFSQFNQFFDYIDKLLQQGNWEGDFQVASFHPDYQFANTQSDDAENLTNRAPYPVLHIIRESSLEKVLADYPDPDSIYKKNIATMESLSQADKQRLFPYLIHGKP